MNGQGKAGMHFVKAHAYGNDFLVIEQSAAHEDEREHAVQLCARTTNVGADGVEYLRWTGERSGSIRLYNADGSIAEISGNGTRCVAAWMAYSKGAVSGESLTIETEAGTRICKLIAVNGHRFEIAQRMGVPSVKAASVVLDGNGDAIEVEGAVVNTGNPHFVIFVDNAEFTAYGRSWHELGRAICFHPDFPAQTNVEFVHVRSESEIAIRIFERGVGPTSSSGTGTCATSSAAIALRGCSRTLLVEAPGGTQQVVWESAQDEILLTGEAEIIAIGEAFALAPHKAACL